MKAKKIKNGFELSFKDAEEERRLLPFIEQKVNLSNFARRTLMPSIWRR